MQDYLTAQNHRCLIERKARAGAARDVLEDIGPEMERDEKNV